MVNKKRFILASLVLAVCCSVTAAAASLNDSSTVSADVGQYTTAFDSSTWYSWNNTKLNPTADGDVHCSNGQMYSTSKLPVIYDAAANTMTVQIDFSMVKNPYSTHQWMPMISPKAIANYDSFKYKLGTGDDFIGFRAFYTDENSYNNKWMRISACSGKGNWLNDYYTGQTVGETATQRFNPTDGARHSLYFIMDANGISAKLDNDVIVAKGSTDPYYFLKADGSKYTVSDFVVDGVPSVYFGLDDSYGYQTTIYNIAPAVEEEYDNVTFDGTKWKVWNHSEALDVADGKFTVPAGGYYGEKLTEVNYDADKKTMRVNVQFSYDAVKQTDQAVRMIPFISRTAITEWPSDSTLNEGNNYIAATMYYQTEEHYTTNDRMLVRIGDYTWNSTAHYQDGMDPTDGATHTLTYIMTESAVTLQIDGTDIAKDGVAYQCKKDASTLFTINDFLVDGQPSVYFGAVCRPNWGTLKIHNTTNITAESLETLVENALTKVGTSIRVDAPTGIRFTSHISLTVYNYLVNKVGEENVEMGTLLLPGERLGSDALTHSSSDVLVCERTTWFDDDGSFVATLIEVPEASYGQTITARAYVKYTLDGTEYVVYGEQFENSVVGVATSALADNVAAEDVDNGYIYAVTVDGETVYSRFTQDQIGVLELLAQKK